MMRKMNTREIASWTLIDGVLMFLPFITTLVSERSSIISYYDQGPEKGLKYFKVSSALTAIISIILILIWSPIQLYLDSKYIFTSLITILTGMLIGLYNIQFQKNLILEKYSKVFKMHVYRCFGILFSVIILVHLKINNLHIIPIALMVGSLISVRIFRIFEFDFDLNEIKFLIKMSFTPLILIIIAYLLTNLSRLFLSFHGKEEDLVILLIYVKSGALISFVLMPYANFLKPQILKEYKKNRIFIPFYWKNLATFGLFISISGISSFGILWNIWGLELVSPDFFIFSILIAGVYISWFFIY